MGTAPLKQHILGLSVLSFPVTLLSGCIIHPPAQGRFSGPQSNQKYNQDDQIRLTHVFLWVNSPLKTFRSSAYLIYLTPSPSWVGTSPIQHFRKSPSESKAIKNTTKKTKFGSAVFFRGKEGERPPQNHQT